MSSDRAVRGGPDRGGSEDERGRARDAAVRLLAARARSRAELSDRLLRKGLTIDVVDPLLDDLERAGLIDDADFAEQWVFFRHRDGARSRKALSLELRRKGVEDDLIAEAVGQISDDDERDRAAALVRRTLARRRLPSSGEVDACRREQRRLVGMLARKGYGAELAYSVVIDEWEQVRDAG